MHINGKNINLRVVEPYDAEFIFHMRQNQRKIRYLSKIEGSIQDQREWIRTYKEKEQRKQEFYFIIESKKNEKLGLVRMYDFTDNSFCWGSWLIKDNAPKSTAIESALQIYEYAFYTLGFQNSHFDVRKGNDKVIAFHKRFGAEIVDENDLDFFFNITKDSYEVTKQKYSRYL